MSNDADWIKHELDWLKALFQILAVVDGGLVAYAANVATPLWGRLAAAVVAAVMLPWTLTTYQRVNRLLGCLREGRIDDCK